MVEKDSSEEVFSNGLHIDTRFAVSNHPRSYLAFPLNGPSGSRGVRRSAPAGIVFHTTESLQIPFEARRNRALKRIGESLLEYIGRRCAYHYLIDRFGRVFRVVAEQDAANHAGYSVWADDRWRYINLNESFLGVSFEARTEEGQSDAHVSPAQVRSATMLTELLRGRYRIPATNCVTHLQVSVNPDNMWPAMRSALASSDMVILSGGTSKSAGDLNHRVVARLGAPGIIAHGVALKPGKPLCLAVADGKPVVILPGFPTSAMFTFHDFVVPVLRVMSRAPARRSLGRSDDGGPHPFRSRPHGIRHDRLDPQR